MGKVIRHAWHWHAKHYHYKLQYNRYTWNWHSWWMQYRHGHLPGFKTWEALHKHSAGSWQSWKMLCKHRHHFKKDKSMVIDNEPNKMNYFLPGPSQDSNKRVNTEITQQPQRDFKDVFTGIGCFDGTFSLEVKLDSKPGISKTSSLCPAKAIQSKFRVAQTARYHNTTRCRWDSKMVQ